MNLSKYTKEELEAIETFLLQAHDENISGVLKLIKENSKLYSIIYKPTIFSYSDFGISKDIKNLTDKTLLNKTIEYVKMKDFLKWLKVNYKNKIGVYSGPRKESKMSELKELLKKNEDFKVLSFN